MGWFWFLVKSVSTFRFLRGVDLDTKELVEKNKNKGSAKKDKKLKKAPLDLDFM